MGKHLTKRELKNATKEVRMNEKKKIQKEKRKKTVLVTLSVILGVALLASAIGAAIYFSLNAYRDSGKKYRENILLESADFSINSAMFSYAFYSYMWEEVLLKVDPAGLEDLKNQNLSSSIEKETLYHVHFENALMEAETNLFLAQVGKSNGVKLEEKELTILQNKLDALSYNARSQNKDLDDYLFETYGRGVRLTDIESYLKISLLADKQMSIAYNSSDISKEEIAKYLEEHEINYRRVDYYHMDFSVPYDVKKTEEENKKAHDEVYKMAEQLSETKTPEDFLKVTRALITKIHEKDKDFTEADINAAVKDAIYKGVVVKTEDSESLLGDAFLYNPETAVGSTYIADGKYNIGVYCMVKPVYSIDVPSDLFYVIELDSKNYAKRSDATEHLKNILKEWEKSGKTTEDFKKLAVRYSEDGLTSLSGGLYADTYSKSDLDSKFEEFKKTGIKKGEVRDCLSGDKLFLVLYDGTGESKSYYDAKIALKQKAYNDLGTSYTENKDYEVTSTENEKLLAPLLLED